jgi:hypothetical protein
MAADEQSMNELVTPTVGKSKPAGRKRRSQLGANRTRRAAQRTQPSQTRSLARNYGRKASGLARRGKRLVDDAYGWVDAAVPRIAAKMNLPSGRRIASLAEANPVLLGAVGFGIGVVIGVLMPRNAIHTGMQELEPASTSVPTSARSRKAPRTRARK